MAGVVVTGCSVGTVKGKWLPYHPDRDDAQTNQVQGVLLWAAPWQERILEPANNRDGSQLYCTSKG